MDDNVMNLIDRLIDAETDNARLGTKLSALQRIVDREEYEATKRQIERGEQVKEPAYTAISVSEIRKIFGWGYPFLIRNLICPPEKKEES